MVAAHLAPGCDVTITDINPAALRLARINARAAGVPIQTVLGETLSAIERPIDLAIANPPYIVDPAGRTIRLVRPR